MVVRQYLNGPFNTAYGEGVCLWCSGRTFPLTNKIATNQTSHFIFLFWKLVHFSNFPAISYHFQQYFSDIGVGNDRPVASHWQTLSHNVVHLVLIKIQTRIFAPTALGGFQHSLHSFMPLHHVKSHYNLILYYTSTLCRASGGITARQRVVSFFRLYHGTNFDYLWLFASNSPVFVEWVIIINAKWAIFLLYHDESFLERVIIFQRYHGKNKLYLMRWFPLCTRPFEHT